MLVAAVEMLCVRLANQTAKMKEFRQFLKINQTKFFIEFLPHKAAHCEPYNVFLKKNYAELF